MRAGVEEERQLTPPQAAEIDGGSPSTPVDEPAFSTLRRPRHTDADSLPAPSDGAGLTLLSLPEHCLRFCLSLLPVEETLRAQLVAVDFARALGIIGPALEVRNALALRAESTRALQQEITEPPNVRPNANALVLQLVTPFLNCLGGTLPSNNENDSQGSRRESPAPLQPQRMVTDSRGRRSSGRRAASGTPAAAAERAAGRPGPRRYEIPSAIRGIQRPPPSIFAITPLLTVAVSWWWTTPHCRVAYFSQFLSLERLSLTLYDAYQFLDEGVQFLLRRNRRTLRELTIAICPRVSCIDGKDRGPPPRSTDCYPIPLAVVFTSSLPRLQTVSLTGSFTQTMVLLQDVLRLKPRLLTSLTAFCRGETGFSMTDELLRGQMWDSVTVSPRPLYRSTMEDERRSSVLSLQCPPMLRKLVNYPGLSNISLRLPTSLNLTGSGALTHVVTVLPRVRSLTTSFANVITLAHAVETSRTRGGQPEGEGEASKGFPNLTSIEVNDMMHFGYLHDDWDRLLASAKELKHAVMKVQHVILHHETAYSGALPLPLRLKACKKEPKEERQVEDEEQRAATVAELFQEKGAPPLSKWGKQSLCSCSSWCPMGFRSSQHKALCYFAPTIQTLCLRYYAQAGRDLPLAGVCLPQLRELFIEDLNACHRNELAGVHWPVKHPLLVRLTWVAGEDVSFLPFIQSVPHMDFVLQKERDAEMLLRIAEYIRDRNLDDEAIAEKHAAVALAAASAQSGKRFRNPNPYLVCPTITFEFEEIHREVSHVLENAAPLQRAVNSHFYCEPFASNSVFGALASSENAMPRSEDPERSATESREENVCPPIERVPRVVRTSTEMLAEAFVSLRLDQEQRRQSGIPDGTNPDLACHPFDLEHWGSTISNLKDALLSLKALRLDRLVCSSCDMLQTCARCFDTEEESRGGLAAMLRLALCAGDIILDRASSNDSGGASVRQLSLELARKKKLRGPIYAEDGSLLEGLLIEDIKLLNISDCLRPEEQFHIYELFGVTQLRTRHYREKLRSPSCCAKAFGPEGGELRIDGDGRIRGPSSTGCTCHYFFCPVIEAHLRLLLKCIPTIKRVWLTYARHHPFAVLDGFDLSRRAAPILAFFESAGFTVMSSALGEEYEAFNVDRPPQITRFLLARTGPPRCD